MASNWDTLDASGKVSVGLCGAACGVVGIILLISAATAGLSGGALTGSIVAGLVLLAVGALVIYRAIRGGGSAGNNAAMAYPPPQGGGAWARYPGAV